jgi:hypothetical protein
VSTSFPAFRRRAVPALAALASAAAVGGCGSSSGSGVSVPTIGAAKVFTLAGFQPSAPVLPGRSTIVSFTIQTPAGKPLTAYKQCCEPHAGVDLIMVRSDDSQALYEGSDIAADGRITQRVVFPAPGRYRIVVDAYPKQTSPESPVSFQLFTWVTVRGSYRPQPVAPFGATQFADGYLQIRGDPHLKADQANFLDLNVVDPQGRKASFAAWCGAARSRMRSSSARARLITSTRTCAVPG